MNTAAAAVSNHNNPYYNASGLEPVKFEREGGTKDVNVGIKPHEILQNEVERIYKEYTEIARSNDSIRAQQVYQLYQKKYDLYIQAYERFAQQFQEQGVVKSEGETKKDLSKEDEIKALIRKIEEKRQKQDDDDEKNTVVDIKKDTECNDKNDMPALQKEA